MVAIPFPLSSSPGRTPHESAGRLLNCYAEPLGTDINTQKGYAPPKAVWRRVPGLKRFATTSNTGYRGGIQVASTYFAAFEGVVKSYNSSGAESSVGSLDGTAKCFWARNNNASPQIVVVDPQNGAFVVTANSVVSFPDPDLPSPCDVFFEDGYLIFSIGDGRMFATDINDITVNSLDFAKAETKADSLLRGIPFNGQAMFFGTTSIEVWSDTAQPTGFPYTRAAIIARGLAGRYAVAGHEDGFGGALAWVAENNTVVRLNGYQAEKISPPDLDRLIEAVEDKETLEASVYVAGGQPRWVLSCEDWTWEFCLNSQKWNEGASYQLNRRRSTQFQSIFGKWIGGQTTSGNLVSVDDTAQADDGDPLLFRIESGPIQKFPHHIRVDRVDFDFSLGQGVATGSDPTQTSPSVAISWSTDGGTKWSVPVVRKLGPQRSTNVRVTVNRCGLAGPQGMKFRLDISDPVTVAFLGGDATIQVLN